jgi:lysyl-tRNA synthetase, class II
MPYVNIESIRNNFIEGQPATVFGRVTQIRILSKKLAFVVVEDTTSSIQIGVRSANLPSKLDIIKASGLQAKSKTGELTIWDDNPQIICKNEGDLPSFEGITNPEVAREKRHLQILTNKELKQRLLLRSKIVSCIRSYLDGRGFVELETPILSSTPSGANAKPFVTKSEALNQDFYLRIATETHLKKALIGGFERVYEIGRIFRNEGIDRTHNPEFTSIELYQSFAGLHEMREILLDIVGQFSDIRRSTIGPDIEYDDLIAKYGTDFDKHLSEPTFVYGHPAEDTPLCKLRLDGRCDRFEFFVNGYEIANAYNELTDWREQAVRLNGKNDDGLVDAMKYGMPPTGGMGIGIDRLVMALTNTNNIADVMVFPSKRG